MPVMDGIERHVHPSPGAGDAAASAHVALTAYAIKGDRECFLEEGFDGYLSKPITSLELYETIEGLALWSVPSSTGIPESSRDGRARALASSTRAGIGQLLWRGRQRYAVP